MRGTRWLLLLIIVAFLCGIGARYRAQKIALREQDQALVKPAPLPLDLNSTSEAWDVVLTDTHNGTARTKAEIKAQSFNEQKDSGRVDLKGVTLRLPNKKADAYNLVKSAAASYFKGVPSRAVIRPRPGTSPLDHRHASPLGQERRRMHGP